MAEEQLNTLTGDLTKLSSAWEGFVLSVENGEGVISKAARGIVQALTEVINITNDEDLSFWGTPNGIGWKCNTGICRSKTRSRRIVDGN